MTAPKGKYLQVAVDSDEVCGLRLHHTIRCHYPAPLYGYGPARLGLPSYRYTEVGDACGLRGNGRIVCFDAGQSPNRYKFKQFSGGTETMVCAVVTDGMLYPKSCEAK